MKYILFIILLVHTIFANNDFVKEEQQVFQNDFQSTLKAQSEDNQLSGLNEKDIEDIPSAKNLYLSYIEFPENIYKNQRFEIVLKALITTEDFDTIKTKFIDSKNMNVLNPEQPWMALDKNSFENKFFFKAYEEDFVLPTFQVLLYKNEQLVDLAYLKPKVARFSKLAKGDNSFSNIIAKDLIINTYKTKQYNNKELLTILDIDATYSNLEDFYLKEYSEDQGISNIEDEYPKQHILYYVVVPIHKKKISFTYFNTTLNRFDTISLPLELEDELVSTQTDLNPNNSNFELYKKILLLVVLLLFLILFIWKKKYIYLLIVLILLSVAIIYLMPNKNLIVKKETLVYILPTNKSTVFYKFKNNRKVEVLTQKNEYTKIMFTDSNLNKIIGWIKEDRFGKN